jgi:MFS family permease
VSESETLADVGDGSAPLLEAGPAGDEPRPGRTLIFAIVSIGLFHYGRERDRAVGMFTSILPIGGIIGPIIGGVFVSYWSWRGIFLVNVPIGILLITLVARFIPATSARVTRRIDVPGVVLLAGAILAGMFGITYLGTGDVPWYSPVFLGCEAVAGVSAWLFVRHARTFAAPFVPYRLLRGRGFGVMNLINLIYGAAALGFAALVPLYGQERYGIAPLGAGTLLTARPWA